LTLTSQEKKSTILGVVKIAKRTKLKNRELPRYTRAEETVNMITHIVGGAFGIGALILCVVTAIYHRNMWGLAGGIVYGVSMILVYSISSVYHGLRPVMAKKVMQIIDHCSVYLLIAGSYTPPLLSGIRKYNTILCFVVLALVWSGSIFGIIFKAIDLYKYRVLTMFCYFAVGWSMIFLIKPLLAVFPLRFLGWIFSGGIVYTLGMIFFSIGRKKPYFHSIFHLFILGGSILQFFGILFYCM
jgi:hemolysin III